jgi:DEAD/DEAH box helicase domain-containing protein
VTPTASGKTLCYNPAILENCLLDPTATALYIFPLKALANDQYGKIGTLIQSIPTSDPIRHGILTGDIPANDRIKMFNPMPPQILVMSPDLLHHQLHKSKSPDWESWRIFLRNLKYIVIDEMHTYQGTFAINFANLIRRLLYSVERVGGDAEKLQFI